MTSGPRILFLVNALEPDAPTRITAAIASAFKKLGWKVRFVAWSRSGSLQRELADEGLDPSVLGSGTFASSWKLAELLNTFRPLIIHSALTRPTLGYALARVFARSSGTCWVAADHGIHEWHERGVITGVLMEILMPALLTNADQVITVSPDARRQLLRRGLSNTKLRVIPNGVDTRRFYPRLRRDRRRITDLFPSENGEQIFLIGAAGNLRYIKGMDILVEAAAVVIPAVPNARFILWGAGPEMEALKNRVQCLGIEHAVAFAGYEPQLEELLPMLDLYVQPSRAESFGLGAAEAMASGVPVIVADVGGLSDLVVHEVSGLTFRPGSTAELAAAIGVLYNNNHIRGKLAEAGRLRVLQYYSRQGMVSATVRLYEQLLQGGPTSHD